jgi:hypothetical protein
LMIDKSKNLVFRCKTQSLSLIGSNFSTRKCIFLANSGVVSSKKVTGKLYHITFITCGYV